MSENKEDETQIEEKLTVSTGEPQTTTSSTFNPKDEPFYAPGLCSRCNSSTDVKPTMQSQTFQAKEEPYYKPGPGTVSSTTTSLEETAKPDKPQIQKD